MERKDENRKKVKEKVKNIDKKCKWKIREKWKKTRKETRGIIILKKVKENQKRVYLGEAYDWSDASGRASVKNDMV